MGKCKHITAGGLCLMDFEMDKCSGQPCGWYEEFKTVGQWASSWRQLKGLSQKDIADKLHCSIGNVSMFENDKNQSFRMYSGYRAMGMPEFDFKGWWAVDEAEG